MKKETIEKDFFREEIRCGFRVTEKTKKVWAVQLAILDEVERICKKHQILYFADSGTLIGAVRDKGYIPWDDDIDLVMPRADYERFIRIAPQELSEDCVLQTAYTEKNYLRGHAQIRNKNTTGGTREDLRAGYCCGIFVDLFPLDAMPDQAWKQVLWAKELTLCWTVLYNWYRYDCYENKSVFGAVIHWVGTKLNIPIPKAVEFYEAICRKYEKKNTKWICDPVFIRQLKKNTWKKEWFLNQIYVPFENRSIPIPSGYDERLRAEYGEYRKPAQAPTMHGDLTLEPEIPWEQYLKLRACDLAQ